ncbi:hypothetical protein FOCC_FOCC003685 [Frankliniella occidentalis]|nr:hypothetical protein FOCC_FOCC003685 [Frankliniella occidentalis]
MSLKVLIALAVVMVCALAFTEAEPMKAGMVKAEMVKGVDEVEETHARIVRSPADTKPKLSCADKACVKGCRMVNGKPECLP